MENLKLTYHRHKYMTHL